MNRRNFLALSGIGLARPLWPVPARSGPLASPGGAAFPAGVADSELHDQLVAQTDAAVEGLLERQVTTRTRWFGGVPGRYGIHSAGSASGLVRHLSTAWVCPESRYHHAPRLLERIAAAMQFLLTLQHDDGTIDLHTTNFHSPPDTGFVMEHVCVALSLLRADGLEGLAEVDAALLQFIEAGAGALAVGGIHTPNHRWVVCMALARAHTLKADPRYVARIEQWLGEKIDIDPDGQFTERSTSIYSPLTDRCLITVARLLERPELLDPVRQNLEMTAYYMHADGEVATEGSRRQDQYVRGSMSAYHYSYRYMALHDRNGRFAAVARSIAGIAANRLTSDLGLLLEDPSLRGALPESAVLPTSYSKHFRHSDLVRIRRGETSATILGGNPTFFSLHKGSAAVVVRLAQAFFGKGQFSGDRLTQDGEGWVLEQNLEGPYYQPLPADQLPEDGDWHKMDRELRATSEVQKQRSTVRVTEKDGTFELHIQIAGTERVPLALELSFRDGGTLHGVQEIADQPSAWLLADKVGRFEYGENTIEFGPGRGEHRYTQVRGALPKLQGDSVYITGFTPFELKLALR